jgi:hypothetical protein
MDRSRKPLACRLSFHRWEVAHTGDGAQYVRCRRCLKERWTGPGPGKVTGPSMGPTA